MPDKHHDKQDPFDLEQFVKDQQPVFNQVEQLDENALWKRIQPHTPKSPDRGWKIELGNYWKWSIAASILLLVTIGFYFGQQIGSAKQIALADYLPDLQEEAESYQQLILQKQEDLNFSEINPQLYQEIFEEFKFLEQLYQEMMEELPAFSDQEKLIQSLKKYYERKLFLLEKLNREIEKNKKQQNEEENATLM
jgi:hypothetical protein